MFLLLLVGCDPCGRWSGTEVVDEHDLLDEDTLARMRSTVGDFYAWSGATDACVDRVDVDDLGDDRYEIGPGAAPRITIDRRFAVSGYWLRYALCTVLADRRGWSETYGDDFLGICGEGIRRFDWADEVMTSCGTSHLTSLDAAVRELVWVDADLHRPHGYLGVAPGAAYTLTGLAPEGSSLGDIAAAGDLLAFEILSGESPTQQFEVAGVLPTTGARAFSVAVDDFGDLVAAPGGVVLNSYDDGFSTLTAIDLDGTARTVVVPMLPGNGEAVADDRFYSAWPPTDERRPMTEVDLSTGEQRDIDLPAPPGLLPVAWPELGLGDLLLVDLMAAEVDEECGGFDCSVTIWTFDRAYALYDPVSGAWTEVGRDFYFSAAGVTTSGLAMGSVEVAAGSVYAAWDPITGELWVSDELCAEEYGRLGLVMGDTAYRASFGDDDASLLMRPMALTFE